MTEVELRAVGFAGDILHPLSPTYRAAVRRENAAAERDAVLIVFPISNEDVSLAIKYATRSNLPIAVKCGGHHFSAASSAPKGLVIDMKALRAISINKINKTVTVGGGCLWGHVYGALRAENLVCVGGGVHAVGVGGHVSGGGYGPYSFKYGMACDNILEATVVIADGRILKASETNNADLLFAIRGGSSSFGVITQFVLRTFPDLGPYRFRSLLYSSEKRHDVFSAFRNFYTKTPSEKEIFGFMTFARSPTPQLEPVVIVNFFAFARNETYSDIFGLFETIGPLRDTSVDCPSLVEFSHILDDQLLRGAPRKAITSAPITALWPGMPEELWVRWKAYTDGSEDVQHTKIMLEFHKSIRVNPAESCIPIIEKRHAMCIASEEHHERDNDKSAEAWSHEIASAARSHQILGSGQDLGLYGNGCSSVDKSAELWGVHYPRLRKVKAKYDPYCVFNQYHQIVPDFDTASL